MLASALSHGGVQVHRWCAFGGRGAGQRPEAGNNDAVDANAALVKDGKQTFRFDTFGDQPFWGGTLHLDQAIAGAANGGVGPGVSPKTALSVGLKVDVDALPASVQAGIKAGTVEPEQPGRHGGVAQAECGARCQGHFDAAAICSAVGIECALCHSTVDNSLAPGIGHRLDGWANRDLNVGAIVGLSPNLTPIANLLHTDVPTVQKVLDAWGPGKFDAELFLDGKAIPAGRSFRGGADTAGVRTGRGQPAYLDGMGLRPVLECVRCGVGDARPGELHRCAAGQRRTVPDRGGKQLRSCQGDQVDLVSAKLPALQAYQLSLKAPTPPKGSFDPAAAARGKVLFSGQAECSTCHVAANLHRTR